MKILNRLKAMTTVAAVCAAVSVMAADKTVSSPYLAELSHATAIELPNQSAQLVVKADGKTRPQVTAEVVKTALGLNPGAAGAVVGCIAQVVPEMAPVAAGTAVSLVPNQAENIARVAAAAAPAQAGAIVEAICRVLPKKYQGIANAAAEVAPGQDKKILAGVASAMPALKKAINQTLLGYSGQVPSVNSVLTQASKTQSLTDPVALAADSSGTADLPARGPSAGAPFVPISGTPIETTTSSGGITPNPVNYSAP